MRLTFDERELLQRVDNDQEFLRETVEMLRSDGTSLLSHIRTAVDCGDSPGIARAAHTLKGMISNFCSPTTQAAALAVEQMGKHGDFSSAPAAVDQLEARLNALIDDLTDFLATRA